MYFYIIHGVAGEVFDAGFQIVRQAGMVRPSTGLRAGSSLNRQSISSRVCIHGFPQFALVNGIRAVVHDGGSAAGAGFFLRLKD